MEEKPFKCPHCNRSFSRTSGLNMHINVTHLKINSEKRGKITCHICETLPAKAR
jgi:transcription elongation factor Elf1